MPTTHTTTTTTAPTATRRSATGQTVELATYTCDIGARRIVGQRVDGVVQLRDEPAAGHGRSFLIEGDLHSKAEMDAIVTDYLEHAKRLGFVPMFSLGW